MNVSYAFFVWMIGCLTGFLVGSDKDRRVAWLGLGALLLIGIIIIIGRNLT